MLFSSQRAGAGGTGCQSEPSGDSPDGMATRFEHAATIPSNLSLPPISFGDSPDETGEFPVPPLPVLRVNSHFVESSGSLRSVRFLRLIGHRADGVTRPPSCSSSRTADCLRVQANIMAEWHPFT